MGRGMLNSCSWCSAGQAWLAVETLIPVCVPALRVLLHRHRQVSAQCGDVCSLRAGIKGAAAQAQQGVSVLCSSCSAGQAWLAVEMLVPVCVPALRGALHMHRERSAGQACLAALRRHRASNALCSWCSAWQAWLLVDTLYPVCVPAMRLALPRHREVSALHAALLCLAWPPIWSLLVLGAQYFVQLVLRQPGLAWSSRV